MSAAYSKPRLGQIVRITHGREAGQYMIVIKQLNDRFVLLADGDKRKYDQPKKKNILHFEMMDYISAEIQNSLLETNRVTNGKLRYALYKYIDETVVTDDDDKKGDEPDVKRRSN